MPVRLRRLRLALSAAFATVVIAAAVGIGLLQLALPWLAHNPQRVEAWLAARLGREVRIGHLEGLWTRSGPQLVLERLHLGPVRAGGSGVDLPRAELAIDLHAPLRRRPWNEFRVVGLELALNRAEDGRWTLEGLDSDDSSEPASMGVLGALVLKDLRLRVNDAKRDIHLALLAPELHVINRGEVNHVVGKVQFADTDSPPLDLVADVDQARGDGAFYVGARDLDLARVLAGHAIGGVQAHAGRGDVQIWTRWHGHRVDAVRARLDLGAVTLAAATPIAASSTTEVLPFTHVERLAGVARWQRGDGEDWTLDLADLALARRGDEGAPARLTIERSGGETPRWRAGARSLALEPFGSLAMLSDRLPPGLRRWLYLADPEGRLDVDEFEWNGADDYRFEADLSGYGQRSADAVPGIERLDAHLRGDAAAILVELPPQALRVDYPKVFRKPFAFSRFGGDLAVWREDDAWRIGFPALAFDGEGYAGEARGTVSLVDGRARPLLDVAAVVDHADVAAAKLFWPVNVMPPPAVDWLDHALAGGRVVEGRAVLHGDLADWPFRNLAGRFEARADLEDLSLAYHREWPTAERVRATARFVNEGLQVDADAGGSLGVAIEKAAAAIPDLGDAVLDLAVKGSGGGANLLDFLRATPIGREHAEHLESLRVGGKGALDFRLELPIRHIEQLRLDGTVDLRGADLAEPRWGLDFADANGLIRFDRSGFATDDLAVTYRQHPAALSLAVGGHVGDPAHVLEARLRGTLPVDAVFAAAPDLAAAFPRFPGSADWRVELAIEPDRAGQPGRKRLSLSSDLQGIAITLPAPLSKPAAAALPFELNLDLPYAGQPFNARLGDLLQVRGRLPDATAPLAARLEFGGRGSEPLPDRGIVIAGAVPLLDTYGWIDEAVAHASGGSGGLLRGITLDVANLAVSDRHFEAVRLDLQPGAEATTVSLDGATVVGSVRVPSNDLMRQGLTLQFDRLYWPEAPPGEANAVQLGGGTAPGSVPPLHVWVRDLKFGAASFGEARMETYPAAGGMRIDRLETKSPNVDMHARGDWTGEPGATRSHLTIDMSAHNLGRMLDALGFAGIIDGGQTLAQIDAGWPGPPGAFAFSNLDGTLEVSVDKGRILDVDPGAGRIFGLMSLREIPRRLSLDFSDLFRSGMSFNSIGGRFTLRDGNAYTDNLRLSGPAADIALEGRTGLRVKDYDQQMLVTPHAGATLPVVGALAGGPVGAAAGLVVQGLLNKQISQATRSRYHISGTWEKPVITLLKNEPAASPH